MSKKKHTESFVKNLLTQRLGTASPSRCGNNGEFPNGGRTCGEPPWSFASASADTCNDGAVHSIVALLSHGDIVHFTVHGPSMNPLIRTGDTVYVRPIGGGELKPGAILLFRYRDRLVLHRLVRHDRRENRFWMAADAALDGLDYVSKTDLLGIAESVGRDRLQRRLDTCRSRWSGLMRYYARPIRRMAVRWLQRYRRSKN